MTPRFEWVNKERIRTFGVYVLQAIAYTLIAKAISLKIADKIGNQATGFILSANAVLSLVAYPLGVAFASSRRKLLVLMALSIGTILLMMQGEWLPVLWVFFGPISSIIYTVTDGLFQRTLEPTKRERKLKEEYRTKRLDTAFSVTSFFYYTLIALAGLVGVWIAANHHVAWILSAVIFMIASLLIFWFISPISKRACKKNARRKKRARTRKRKKKQARQRWLTQKRWISHQKRAARKRKQRVVRKQKTHHKQSNQKKRLITTALPFLGCSVSNAAVNVAIPIFLDPLSAGLVLFVNSITNAVGYILPMKKNTGKRRSYVYLTAGILMFPLGEWIGGIGATIVYLTAGVLIGVAVSQSKLYLKRQLFSISRNDKEKGSAALSSMSDLGYVLGPLLIGLAEYGALFWLVTALFPMIAVLSRR